MKKTALHGAPRRDIRSPWCQLLSLPIPCHVHCPRSCCQSGARPPAICGKPCFLGRPRITHKSSGKCLGKGKSRGAVPFLAFVPDNGFKSVCQMKWVNSITQPQSNVNRTHPHPHHTPLVNGFQHLCARN